MARAPERHYPDEESRRRAEELDARLQEACRKAAPMFLRNLVEMELEAEGRIDTAAGEHVVDLAMRDGELFAKIETEPEEEA